MWLLVMVLYQSSVSIHMLLQLLIPRWLRQWLTKNLNYLLNFPSNAEEPQRPERSYCLVLVYVWHALQIIMRKSNYLLVADLRLLWYSISHHLTKSKYHRWLTRLHHQHTVQMCLPEHQSTQGHHRLLQILIHADVDDFLLHPG